MKVDNVACPIDRTQPWELHKLFLGQSRRYPRDFAKIRVLSKQSGEESEAWYTCTVDDKESTDRQTWHSCKGICNLARKSSQLPGRFRCSSFPLSCMGGPPQIEGKEKCSLPKEKKKQKPTNSPICVGLDNLTLVPLE